MSTSPYLVTEQASGSPSDPLLELRRAIATELAVMAFEERRNR